MDNTRFKAFQRKTSDKEGGQNNIRKCCCEVNNLQEIKNERLREKIFCWHVHSKRNYVTCCGKKLSE